MKEITQFVPTALLLGVAIAFVTPDPQTPSDSKGSGRRDARAQSGLILPTQGRFTQGLKATHEGIDIANNTGTPVLAAASGVVTEAGWDSTGWGLGWKIIIRHNELGNITTTYAHNHEIFVKPGQKVFQGDTIAHMGATGNSDGSHLHFEVRDEIGRPLDPCRFVSCPQRQDKGGR